MGNNDQEQPSAEQPVERLINAEKRCPYWGRPCAEVRANCRKWIPVQEVVMHPTLGVPRLQEVNTCMEDQVMHALHMLSNVIAQSAMRQPMPGPKQKPIFPPGPQV